jgi:hypothetical protein
MQDHLEGMLQVLQTQTPLVQTSSPIDLTPQVAAVQSQMSDNLLQNLQSMPFSFQNQPFGTPTPSFHSTTDYDPMCSSTYSPPQTQVLRSIDRLRGSIIDPKLQELL